MSAINRQNLSLHIEISQARQMNRACVDCGRDKIPATEAAWKVRCYDCWKQQKAAQQDEGPDFDD